MGLELHCAEGGTGSNIVHGGNPKQRITIAANGTGSDILRRVAGVF